MQSAHSMRTKTCADQPRCARHSHRRQHVAAEVPDLRRQQSFTDDAADRVTRACGAGIVRTVFGFHASAVPFAPPTNVRSSARASFGCEQVGQTPEQRDRQLVSSSHQLLQGLVSGAETPSPSWKEVENLRMIRSLDPPFISALFNTPQKGELGLVSSAPDLACLSNSSIPFRVHRIC